MWLFRMVAHHLPIFLLASLSAVLDVVTANTSLSGGDTAVAAVAVGGLQGRRWGRHRGWR